MYFFLQDDAQSTIKNNISRRKLYLTGEKWLEKGKAIYNNDCYLFGRLLVYKGVVEYRNLDLNISQNNKNQLLKG